MDEQTYLWGDDADAKAEARTVGDEIARKALDAARGAIAKEEAISRVEANASRAWLDEAKAALLGFCARPQFVATITSDDVWVVLQLKRVVPPHEPRAMGPVMRWGVSEGVIRATDRFVPSELPQNHRRPVRVYEVVR